ncbi:MAG TPA: hypothetical protein VGR93_11115 [Candidatus Acidoferrales bacterium]|nr:hypothetical protein [Candidatus Acidoferrales bacterium]
MTLLNLQPLSRQSRSTRGQQAGVALLIAIFTLLIVSAVAAALVMSSGTESSLAANYRSSASVYYAGLAGLEEARGRLLPSNPNFFNNTVANFVTLAGKNPTLAVGQVRYILNPLPGEVVAPTTLGNKYYDNEYTHEWNTPAPPAIGAGTPGSLTIPSVSTVTVGGTSIQGPMYKWVRITAATEQSLNIDVNNDGVLNALTPVFYDPSLPNAAGKSGTLTLTPTANASQIFQIAADAVLPNGTQKIMEYVAAPFSFNLNLPSALTMPGPIGSFNPPNSNGYCMDGNDTAGLSSVSGCSYTPAPPVAGCGGSGATNPAVGVSPGNDNAGSNTNVGYVTNQIPRPGNYLGPGGTSTTPSVGTPSLPTSLSSPAALNQELALIQQNANVCLGCSGGGGGTYTFSDLDTASGSLWGSSGANCGTSCGTIPQVTYVNGNLDISGSTAGSGILVVTGNLTYSGNSSWNGIILVVGNGLTTYLQNGGGNGQFNGAIFVANTAGNPPGTYGAADFTINGGGGNGLYYNSCWIANSQKPISLKILSFREISN